jgi:initiation factor 1A
MVKNLKGGKGHKKLGAKYSNIAQEQTQIRLKKDVDERYGMVESILGNGHFYVCCDDDQKRICRIGGKFKKRRRDNLVVKNGFVLIGLYGFETQVKDKMEKCDLLETYTDTEVKRLLDKEKDTNSRKFIEKVLNQQFESTEKATTDDKGFDFLTDDEIMLKKQFEEELLGREKPLQGTEQQEGNKKIDDEKEQIIDFEDI